MSTLARIRGWVMPGLLCSGFLWGCSVGDVTPIERDAGGTIPDSSLDADSSAAGAGGVGGQGGAGGSAGASGGAGFAGAGGVAGSGGGAGAAGAGGVGGSAGVGGSGGDAGVGGAGGAGGAAGDAGAGGAAGAGPTEEITFLATVADCVDPDNPNPDTCAAVDPEVFRVDLEVSEMGNAMAVGFVRFEPGGPLVGRTIVRSEVRFTVGSKAGAESTQTGTLWQVEPFTRADLFLSPPPAQVGQMVGVNQGAVVLGQVVTWPVPTALISAGDPLCFGIYPVTNNGVDYLGVTSASPPELFIEYQ